MESNIYGFDRHYTITEYGDVYSYSKYDRKLMRQSTTGKGYKSVCLKRHGRNVVKLVHRLVAMAYVVGYKNGLQVNHKDGVKANNLYTNLEWVTPKENSLHSRRIGLYDNKGRKHSMAKLNELNVMNIRAVAETGAMNYVELGRAYGVNKTCIRKIVEYETWRYI